MLAWRGKRRADLLATLRKLAGPGAGPRAGAGADGREAASRALIDVSDPPLAECVANFWSPGLSPARLRTLPPATAAPPDLLLRTFEPPLIAVDGRDLVTLLRPAYLRLAGEAVGEAGDTAGGGTGDTAAAGTAGEAAS
jgi:hypothetical protein